MKMKKLSHFKLFFIAMSLTGNLVFSSKDNGLKCDRILALIAALPTSLEGSLVEPKTLEQKFKYSRLYDRLERTAIKLTVEWDVEDTFYRAEYHARSDTDGLKKLFKDPYLNYIYDILKYARVDVTFTKEDGISVATARRFIFQSETEIALAESEILTLTKLREDRIKSLAPKTIVDPEFQRRIDLLNFRLIFWKIRKERLGAKKQNMLDLISESSSGV
jgi:hypothetical protein